MYKISDSCQIQGLEDIYKKYFGERTHGFFIDVGAFDGITFSNTSCFVEAGWSGIEIEPLPKLYEKLVWYCGRNKNVETVCSCVGDYSGEVEIFVVTDDTPLATINKEVKQKNLWGDEYTSSFKCPIITLDMLLDTRYMLDDRIKKFTPFIDLVSIDVEGAELAVLNGFTIAYWQPSMVIVEAHEMHDNPARRFQADDINSYMDKNGYWKIHCDAINNIYVRGDLC